MKIIKTILAIIAGLTAAMILTALLLYATYLMLILCIFEPKLFYGISAGLLSASAAYLLIKLYERIRHEH